MRRSRGGSEDARVIRTGDDDVIEAAVDIGLASVIANSAG
jgi:hypothetical protein